MNTFGKDFFISVSEDKQRVIICKNPNTPIEDLTFEEIEDQSKRYLYKVGDKILTPFGIQTIKEINKDYSEQHGYEWLIFVEENDNQYKPCDLIGIVIKEFGNNILKLMGVLER